MKARALTAWGWVAGIVGALFLIAAVSSVWNGLWSWLPWSAERQLEGARAQAEVATDQAEASRLTAEGEGDTIRRLDTYHHQVVTVRAAVAEGVAEAMGAPDASTPLDPDRAARLRAADRELCRVAPDLGGCAAAADPAGDGADGL